MLSNVPRVPPLMCRFCWLASSCSKKAMQSLRKSGVEEEYNKREQLLDDVALLVDHFRQQEQTDAENKKVGNCC